MNSSILSHSDYECEHSHQKCKHKLEKDKVVTKSRFLIRPNDSLKFKWDILIIIGAIFNCFCIPVQMAYNPAVMEGSIFNILNSVIDFFFILDIFVSFRTTYIDDKGQEVYD